MEGFEMTCLTRKSLFSVSAITFAFVTTTSNAQIPSISLSEAKKSNWTQCAAGAAVGGAIGGLVGNKLGQKARSGGGNAFGLKLGKKEATVLGAGLGAAAGCAIAKNMTKEEQKTVVAVEKEAIEKGKAEKSWQTQEGKTRTATTEAKPIVIAEKPNLTCHETTTTIKDGNETAGVHQQVKCEDENGEYQPAGVLL
jgi:outer membrane lipoprotein SlyB